MVLIGLLLAIASPHQDEVPAAYFARYPAATVRVPHRVPVKLADARTRRNRSALRVLADQRPDFAGHWVIATIGCGASCIQPAALDRLTGRVIWFPGTVCCWPLAESEPLAYRRDSRMLVVQGQLNEQGATATRRYLFDGHRFVLLAD